MSKRQRNADWTAANLGFDVNQTYNARDFGMNIVANKFVEMAMVLPRATIRLVQAVAQVATSGTAVQARNVTDVIDEARRKIYTILAED